jgi:hypothetical protein
MHGTQGNQSLIYGGAATVYAKLLRAATGYDLCLVCHGASPIITFTDEDNKTAPKVFNNPQGGTYNYVPSAGDFRHNNSANDKNRHNMEEDPISAPPGYTGTWSAVTNKFGTKFTCIYCHDVHGNKNYRNLRYDPGDPTQDDDTNGVVVNFAVDSGSPCSDGSATPCDVRVNTSGPNLYKYDRDSVDIGRNGEVYNRISEWCGRCHNDYYGISGDSNMGAQDDGGSAVGDGDPTVASGGPVPWKRHPVGDVAIGQNSDLHSDDTDLADPPEVRYADTDWPPITLDGDEQPICLSCHYAHGGGNPNKSTNPNLDHSMLVFLDDSGDLTLDPASGSTYDTDEGMMRNTCNQCHDQ